MSQKIDLNSPNPFTTRPIPSNFHSNDLLLTDPNMRRRAFVSIEDDGLYQASTIIAPVHLQPGWKWK